LCLITGVGTGFPLAHMQIIVTVGNFTDTDARLSVKKEQP
jgi:hypothetical protein